MQPLKVETVELKQFNAGIISQGIKTATKEEFYWNVTIIS